MGIFQILVLSEFRRFVHIVECAIASSRGEMCGLPLREDIPGNRTSLRRSADPDNLVAVMRKILIAAKAVEGQAEIAALRLMSYISPWSTNAIDSEAENESEDERRFLYYTGSVRVARRAAQEFRGV